MDVRSIASRSTWGSRVRLGVFTLVGIVLALWVAGSVHTEIGPFDTTVGVRPSVSGLTVVRLAPLGSIELDTHDAPLALEVRVDELRLDEAQRIADDPDVLAAVEDDIAADARDALWSVAIHSVIVAVIGGTAGALVASFRLRSALVGATAGLAITVAAGALTVATFDADAVSEPTYSGLLTMAPTAVGDVEALVGRVGEYRAQLTELVANVVTLYRAGQSLPDFDPADDTIRILHVSDIHNNPQAFDLIELLSDQFAIDAVADTGDLTDWGTEPESRLLDRIGRLDVPYIWVRGNHDSAGTQRSVGAETNSVVLDGDAATVAGLRFWGVADARYTPDRSADARRATSPTTRSGVAGAIARRFDADEPPSIDVVMVHESPMAAALLGDVPLVLAGHTHEPADEVSDGTRVLTEGSTGGAGLRGLQGAEPEPLTCSVLYFDRSERRLVAYDRISVEGLGGAGVVVDRVVIPDDGNG